MDKRITIGLYVANIEDTFCRSIFQGASMAARDQDVNLIVFPGKYLHRYDGDDIRQQYEYQYNTLFSYGVQEDIDILAICVGSICSRAPLEAKQALFENVKEKPVLAIASTEESYACIQYDNVTGIREGIRYLVKEQNCERIGMVGGTPTNDDAVERLEAYKNALLENGIAVDESRIVIGDLTQHCYAPVEELLDRCPDLEAIVCVNDDTAQSVYHVMAERGLRAGKDILVMGFDDVQESAYMNPPLATVRADASDLGYESILTCCRMLETGEKPHVELKTKFIPRESVRYEPYDMRILMEKFVNGSAHTMDISAISDGLTEFVFRDIQHDYQAQCQKKVLTIFFERLLGRFFDGVVKRNSANDILVYFQNMVVRGIMAYMDYRKIFQVFDVIYKMFCSQNKILTSRLELHSLLAHMQQGVVEYMSLMIQSGEKKNFEMYHTTNCVTRDILMFNDETEQSYPNSLGRMYTLGIHNSLLYVWDEPVEHNVGEDWNPPSHILLKAYQKEKEVFLVPRTSQKISTRQLLQNKYFQKEQRFSMLIVDVYSQTMQLGLYICDLDYENLHYLEFVSYQLSSAVRTLNLFQLQRATRKRLEESMEQLQANNIVLGTISKLDELTGIYNRRGFYQAAEELLNKSSNVGQFVIICYADMDKLKMVNDTYGHDEGDFAIRSCAKILTDALGKEGIVGRIGGDEFCVISVQKKKNQIPRFQDKIEAVTRLLNDECQKPYPIHLSVGMSEFEYREDTELKAMIEEADDLLYIEKRNR